MRWQLFELHGPIVHDRIAQKIPPRWAAVLSAEDVMQEAYTDAFLHIRGFEPDGPGAFRRWLSTLAKNHLRNALESLETQKRGGNWRRVVPHDPHGSVRALYELLSASGSTPSGKAAGGEAQAMLDWAISRLPPDHQTVVKLYDLESRPVEEVALALNRRPGAVFMLRARAHQALRRLMGERSKYFSSAA